MTRKISARTCPCGSQHPEPTRGERTELQTRLREAFEAVDAAWGLANRTPSLHDYTEDIDAVMVDVKRIWRTV